MEEDRRYQVFVSSTYKDLQDERREGIQVLLEQNCIPAGMELFSAGDEDQWSVIKKVIKDCDYYIVIVGGRYGSMTADGISYTRKEYEYATSLGKPVMAFLHERPGDIAADKTELDSEKRGKLDEFRELLQQKICKNWNSPGDLGGAVSRSLGKIIRSKPATGWIRADHVTSDTAIRMLKLRTRVDELEAVLQAFETQGPSGTEELAQGDDKVTLRFSYYVKFEDRSSVNKEDRISFSWNKIFSHISPSMIDDANEQWLQDQISHLISSTAIAKLKRKNACEDITGIRLQYDDYLTIIVQLRSLGLITQSAKSHNDHNLHWTLTPYGDKFMTKVRAIRKKPTISRSFQDLPYKSE